MVEADLIHICTDLLKVRPEDLDPDGELSEYGVDSILMMEILNAVEIRYGQPHQPQRIDRPSHHWGAGELSCQKRNRAGQKTSPGTRKKQESYRSKLKTWNPEMKRIGLSLGRLLNLEIVQTVQALA